MLHFLRHIRQKIILQDNVRKYLLYAVGEILLVMIGILLALQVNNWNENQKKERTVKTILVQIAKDLNRNLADMSGDVVIHRMGYQSNLKITEALLNNEPYQPEMAFDFWCLKTDEYIFPVTTGYDKLKELGVSSIHNPELEDLLLAIYESIMPRISKESHFTPDLDEYFSEYYFTHFKYNTDLNLRYEIKFPQDTISYPRRVESEYGVETVTLGYVPLDYEALTSDEQFMIMLKESIQFRRYKLSRYDGLIDVTEQAIKLINEELGHDPLATDQED